MPNSITPHTIKVMISTGLTEIAAPMRSRQE